MKELVLTYEDTDQLKLVVENTYFIKGSKGKKGENVDCLTVPENSMLYTVLNGLSDSKVKIKNNKILGTLTCEVLNENGIYTLRPNSNLCIKEYKKYSFY